VTTTSIRTRILLGMTVVLTGVVGLSTLVLEGLLDHLVEEELASSLERAKVAYEHFADTRDRFLEDQARSLAQVPHLKATLDTPGVDGETLEFTLATLREGIDIPLTIVTDAEGGIRACNLPAGGSSHADLRSFAGFEEVLLGRVMSGPWTHGPDVYSLAVSPVSIGGVMLGTLALGIPLDAAAAIELQRVTGRDVTLIDRGRILAHAGHAAPAVPGDDCDPGTPFLLEDEELLATIVPLGEGETQLVLSTSVDAIVAPFRLAERVVLLLGAAIAGIAFLVSNRISLRLAGPIQSLARAVDGFSGGHLVSNLEVEGEDEVAELARSFNAMAERIRALVQEILDKADAAEAASHAKSVFLSTMSHEVRTPLNGILGLTEHLLQEQLTPDQRSAVEDLHASNAQLQELLDEVLDFSESEEGSLDMAEVDFDVERALRGLYAPFATTLEAKGVAFTVDVDEAVPKRLRGPVHRVQQVLRIFLENAVGFTEKGVISVRVAASRRTGDGSVTLRVAVRDTGIGIRAEDQARLFRPFCQIDDSYARDHGGAGLGLALCHKILERMHGRRGVTSEPGAGSEFWFEVPLCEAGARVSPSPAAPLPRTDTAATGATPWRAQQRILVVEDNPVNQRVATLVLARAGWKFSVADHGAAALEQLERDSFDLVLMDLQMPVMDGIEAARRIRAGECRHGRDVPIVALTANSSPEDRAASRAAGMEALVGKPVRYADLVRVLDGFLAPMKAV